MRHLCDIQSLKRIKGLILLVFIFMFFQSYSYADTIFSDSFSGAYPGSWYIGHDGGVGSYAWAWPNGYAHEYSDPSGGQYYYPNDLHVYMEHRYVNLSGYTSATLSFYYIVDTEGGYDFFTVNVKDQYGSWHEMFRASGANDLNWISETINLDQFAGQSGLYIQFRFDSDGSVSGSPYDGVFVDAVQLTADTTSGDIYEPDNSYSQATAQPHNACSLAHSIDPANDQDWVYFDLSTASNIIINTSGSSGDTRMWLYDSSLNEIEYDDDDGDGAFSKIERLYSNALPPGRYYVKIDEFGNDNIIPEYFIELSVETYITYPDLVPYQPAGWDDEIVLSGTTGTNTNTTIYVNQTAYLDFAVANIGNGDTGVGFYVEIWDDTTGERILRGYRSSSLPAGYYFPQEDSQWTFTQSGWHTIRIKVDADNNVSNESNEGNNEYTSQIFVTNDLINENEIPGASNNPSSVPTYLNNNNMYNIGPDGDNGICFATAMTDILAYWDRNPYNGVIFWNLIDHGKAPLTQNALPQNPGHDQADVSSVVINIGTRYYTNLQAQDSIIEDICNVENNLSFNAAFFDPVFTENDKINYFNTIKDEIDEGRPIKAGSLGTYFRGAHAIPVIGYKEFANTSGSEIYIHVNQGNTNSEYVNFFDPLWGGLNLVRIIPGGTPNDEYEDLDGQDDDEKAHSKWLNPQDVYEFRQTHNFKAGTLGFGNDTQDWVKFNAIAGRQYTIETRNLGANCDTKLMVDWDGATYCLYDDDGGDESRASKIVWDCAANTTVYILITEFYESVGHDTNYDLEVTYTNIVVPQTPTPISPYDNEYIYTLYPMFEWSAFQNGGNGATQNGYQFRVRCDTDGDIIVYDTGFISSTSGRTHTYNPGAYSGIDSITGDTRVSQSLQWGKHYHWHVRYRDSNSKWSAWSADTLNSHQDFYTQLPTYTLNINIYPSNTGSVIKNPDKSSYNQNEIVQLTSIPVAGYTFVGWTGDVIGTDNPLSVIMNSNKNITANFTPITYTLNVGVNPPGSGSVTKNPNKSSYNYNEVVQLTASPAAGYTFSSWSGDASGTANPLSVTMNSNKNITANFTPITYTLNVSVNPPGSGSVTKNPNKSSYNYNEVVQLTASPAAGYTFSSWSGDASGTANPLSVTMNSNKNITANFTPITYTLNVSVNPPGSGSVTKNPNKSTYNYNEVVQLTAAPAAGYTFSGWSGDASGTANPLSVIMNSNKNITANFTPITYTLNVSVTPAGSGSVTRNPDKSSYNYNEAVQLTATPAAGYTFSSWSGDASGTANPLSVTMNSNKNITANFTPITYTLNIGVNPPGSGSVIKNPDKSSYNNNEAVQLTAIPAAGYTFSNWSGDASGTANPITVTMSSNKNITANFTPITYTLNVSVNPPGSGSVTKNPDKSSYSYNEVVQLTAIPAAGYTFSNWSGDASGTTNPLSVTMNSNKNITANFTPITYTLNVSVNPPGSGSVTKNPDKSSYSYNEVVQSTATPTAGYTFSGWSGDASGTANPLSVTMNSNKNITANFTPITYTLNVNVNPPGSGSVTKNPDKSSYSYNEVVQLTATPTAGYTFSGWSGNASGIANPLSVQMNSNKSITANFTRSITEGNLSVFPVGSFNSSGVPGGPFMPSSKTYTVTNTGGTSINFTVTKSVGWITLSNAGQTLAPDESIIVTVFINNSARSLAVGSYTDPVSFVNTTNNNGNTSRNVKLDISEKPRLSITSPNNGESWEVGSVHPITWSGSGIVANVIIDYSTNEGRYWRNITNSTENDGIYYWKVPNKPSDKCLIRIRVNNTDTGEIDLSDATFSIIAPSLPTIVVNSPNGREKLSVGSTYMIKWTNIGTVGDVKIEYSVNSGNAWAQIATSSNAGNYAWKVPNTPSNNCLIRVSETDGEPSDVSDSDFSIKSPIITLTSPNGGEDIITGSTHEITWTTAESNWEAKLEYSIDNGTSWVTIILCTPNDGSYMWTVPNTPSDTCLVKISRFDTDEGPMDTSDAVFFIEQGQFLKLTAPNGNEILEPGKNFLIKWESDPAIENIKLEYSPDNGSTYLLIADRISNTGNYEWPVPYHISANCLVRVSNTDGIRPSPQSLVYELKLKIQAANFPVTDNDIFTMWLGDLSKLNETVTHFTPQITITRESNGAYYIRLDEAIKEIQPLSEGWRRLKVFLDIETQLASLWFDDTVIFENLPLKPGINFVPAVSFAVGAENSMAIEIDDLSLQLLTLTNGEDVFSTVFAEDFENFEEAKFPNNSGWKHTLNESRKKNRSTFPEKIEQSVFVYRDFATGVKCLKIDSLEDNQVIVVKPFNIPESYPFDISDKKFSIKSGESTKIE